MDEGWLKNILFKKCSTYLWKAKFFRRGQTLFKELQLIWNIHWEYGKITKHMLLRRAIKTKALVRVQVLLTLEGGGVKEQEASALLSRGEGGVLRESDKRWLFQLWVREKNLCKLNVYWIHIKYTKKYCKTWCNKRHLGNFWSCFIILVKYFQQDQPWSRRSHDQGLSNWTFWPESQSFSGEPAGHQRPQCHRGGAQTVLQGQMRLFR